MTFYKSSHGMSSHIVLNVSADVAGRDVLMRSFEQAGFHVWEAVSADEALSLAPQGPDLILLDSCLADVPGFEVCFRLKEQESTAKIPVLYLGGAPGVTPLSESEPGANLVDRYLDRSTHPARIVDAARDLLLARHAKQLGSLFFEAASDAVVILNEGGVIVDLNPQAEQLFGYRRDELLNRPTEKLVSERMRARHIEDRRAYLKNRPPLSLDNRFRAVGLRKDGTEFPIEIAPTPMQTEFGLFMAGVVRDMTPQRRLEDKLRQRMCSLEDADQHKDHFLTTLAHELSSPLAAVAYSAELLRRSNITEEDRVEAAKIVLEQINFVRRLLEDLSELPRVKRGNLTVKKATIDLAEVARLAVESSRPLIEQRKHALEIVTSRSPIRAQGDAARLAQIVTNLLTNAARYTPEGGQIRLSIKQEGGVAVLKVKDTGIGIPKEMLTRIFNRFTRLEGAKQKYADGKGVGLAFVQRLVEAHGGSVEALSEGEGLGSEFVVRLPLEQDTHQTG